MKKGFDTLPSWVLVVLIMVTFPALVWLERFVPIGDDFISLIDELGWLAILQEALPFVGTILAFSFVGLLGLGFSLVFVTSFSVLVDRMKTGK
ncbi:hypothetical protein [Tateyamaria sp. ANG-S1]|uniref:hypothetical protein n=1 Tax=Tateyamaria sp. ANG-S1 TaxID=1577905 RepID=UPI00187CB93C|nr:hypothetical protein [Tateyamaria sp. ANG-S1]